MERSRNELRELMGVKGEKDGSREREGDSWEKGPGEQRGGLSVQGRCVGKGERYRLP